MKRRLPERKSNRCFSTKEKDYKWLQFIENRGLDENPVLKFFRGKFALPVLSEDGSVKRYNVFHASLLIRHDNNGKMYLYDIIDIKKETSNPLES